MSRLFDNPTAVIMAGGSFLLLLVAVTVLVSLMFRSSRRAAENERARAERKKNRVETYAKRFAAKEACAKALGTGMRADVYWRDMGVVNLRSGQPTMALTGYAAEHLARLTPAGHQPRIHLTLSDEHPYALAFVVIEALPVS